MPASGGSDSVVLLDALADAVSEAAQIGRRLHAGTFFGIIAASACRNRHSSLQRLEYMGDAIALRRPDPRAHSEMPAAREFLARPRCACSRISWTVYRAQPGVEMIREGEGGDFMLMVIEGRVDVLKRDRWNTPQLSPRSRPAARSARCR